MATGPIQRAATARVEQVKGLHPKDQVPGLRGFPRQGIPSNHTPLKVHGVIPAPQGKLAPPGSTNFNNHA
jgi:hypothetical protein